VVIAAAVVAVIFSALSSFYVDLLWFREVDLSNVFWGVLGAKALLTIVFGSLFFLFLWGNLAIVRRLAPTTRVLTPDLEVVERIRQSVELYLPWLIPLFAGVLGLLTGIGVSRRWETFLLWWHSDGLGFGYTEPQFGRDASFYVFSLPWWRFVQGWVFSSLVSVTFISAIAHYLWGGIRPQARDLDDKVAPAVRAHLSVLLGLIVLSKVWGYWLGRFGLLTSKRGVVQGASYTDVKAQLPALNLLAIAAVICALLFFANARWRIWTLPAMAVGLLAIASVIIGAAFPAFIQRFQVDPQELQSERPYIERNIAGTRFAFGLDGVVVTPRAVAPALTRSAVEANEATVDSIRLWRQSVLLQNYQALQRIRQYYEFVDVDVDRYVVAGERRVLMVAAREVSQQGVTQSGQRWQIRHLTYTHGFGAVASRVDAATTEGQPILSLRDIPPDGEPALEQPRVYFGENEEVAFVVVNTGTQEFDFDGATEPFSYDGEGGIPVGNPLQRALLAWRFRDVNLLISGQISSESRILIYRDIEQRARLAAPFLRFDADPYAAIVDGQLVWILDAYTLTDRFPYSQELNLTEATGEPGLRGSANYIRNSVKVTVDAYDGTMTYYITDPEDPIVQVWARAFPGMFVSLDQASPDLRAHLRYPENLLQVQATQFANYHVTDPAAFFQKEDFWAIPPDPTFCPNQPTASVCRDDGEGVPPLRPYYQLLKLPGETSEEFALILPFVPERRSNMVAWLAARSDPERYGELLAYTFPAGRNVLGPAQVFAQINADPVFSEARTLLGQVGSEVLFGDFLVIPIEDAFLYVQPAYVRAAGANTIPELKFVVVSNGLGEVAVSSTLEGALLALTGAAGGEDGEPPPTEDVAELLAQALDHFAAADAALREGDLATYQSELAEARELIERARELAGGAAIPPPTSPGPSPSPTG
jgi:hypothetical protein